MARRRRRGRRQSKRRRARNLAIKVILSCILIVGIIVAFFVWKKYGPTKEQADLKAYYGIEKEDQLAIVVNNGILKSHGMISDGMTYVQYDVVRDYINKRFYWDSKENKLLYALPTEMVSVSVGSKDYTVSKEKNTANYVILKTEGDTAYIALDFIKQYTDMDYNVYDNPSRVMINTETDNVKVAKARKNTQIRTLGGVKSPVLREIKKKEELRVIDTAGSWKKVRTEDGFIGYVKSTALKGETTKKMDRGFKEPEYTNIRKDYKINMAWANVISQEGNATILQLLAASKGLTTVSPTWFNVEDTKGNVKSIVSEEFVNYAHQANIEVWAAVRDFDGGIGSFEESYELLSNSTSRGNLINQLIAATLAGGLDGINVDFEKISVECGEHYIQFIRELSVRCRQNGLVLSVDNYVPASYNQQYHREEQAVYADYVVIMGYDEHYAGSTEAGSVASYDFVENGIKMTLEEVPARKVINGVPFYTRIWKKTNGKLESSAYDMKTAKGIVEQAGAEIEWDETTKQNYATWKADGSTYEVWLEDLNSLEPRLQLIKDYGLAGNAAWRLGQESSDVWNLILKYVN